ncbi:HNH endonuclease [Streptomyces natalensis]|uniref:HNH endonuclease n=1 Tax=Streptomyces natalensis TaxID=68242 RepID=UPI00099B3A2A|nr:HNH endonuclease [Streptomyces natalensis]
MRRRRRPRAFPAVSRSARRPRPAPYDRAEILTRWSGCAYCDGPAEELDHVVPLARGGPDTSDNIVAACRTCNATKYTHDLACWALTEGSGAPCVCDS